MLFGAFKDVLHNQFDFTQTYQFFVPDLTTPSIINFSPTQGEINVNEGRNIVLTISETVVKGAGTITLTPTGGGIVYSMPVDDSSVTIAGHSGSGATGSPTVTVNFPTDLVPGKEYTVTFPSNFVQDSAPTPNGIPAMTAGPYVFQVKTKLLVKFVEQVNLQAVGGKVILMSQGGITHINISDTSAVTFNANEMTIRPSIINQDATGSWVVIIGDGTIKDTLSGSKCAGVYIESQAYHVNEEGREFLFYTTYRVCSTCT